jgi:hypothetical protein
MLNKKSVLSIHLATTKKAIPFAGWPSNNL